MITGDFHVHTAFSTDSDVPVREMLEAAVAKGLQTVCITDHLDADYPEEYEETGEKSFWFDIDKYFDELGSLREEYAGKLQLRIGAELGLQTHLGAFYQELTEKYPFDFVLGSIHLVERKDPYYRELTKTYTDEEMYQKAFDETLRNVELPGAFDVLGHIDYIVRYGACQAEAYSYERFKSVLDEILKRIIAAGKGIELNTAGWKYGLDFCHPHPEVLKRYRELGGEIITVGSDGHCPEHMAYDFKRAEEVLKACGFTYYTQFENRKPKFLKL